MQKLFIAIIFSLNLSSAFAMHQGTYSLNLPNYKLTEKMEFRITHRFLGAVGKDAFLGMDVGANVGLGLAVPAGRQGFRVLEGLDLTLLRSRLNQEYLVSSKLNLVDNPGLGLSLVAGGTNTSIFTQLILTKPLLSDRFWISLIPSFVSAERDTLAVGTAIALYRKQALGYIEEAGLIGEYIPVISGYRLRYPTFALGLKLKTGGHYFSLLFTNSIYTTPNAYLIGSDSTDYYFGFNIVRKF